MSNHVEVVPDSKNDVMPKYFYIIIGLGSATLFGVIIFYVCRYWNKHRRKKAQLSEMTPQKIPTVNIQGVRANHPIQFVVPTTIVINETTEDSLSETDSSGSRHLFLDKDGRLGRKRGMTDYQINPSDIQRGLYPVPGGTFLGDLGKFGFSMKYNFYTQQLQIRLIGATDLPCLSLKTTSNPYAKVVLLPDKAPKFMTKIQHNTVSPKFNELFTFSAKRDSLDKRKLKISLWDYDRFSRKIMIGQIIYPVKDVGICSSISGDVTTGDIWVDLKHDTLMHHEARGELLFSLSYNPDTTTLTLIILKAKGLPVGEKEKDSMVYVKVSLYVRRRIVRTRKTSPKKKTPEIEFNENFHIHVPQGSLSEVDVLLNLCGKSGLGSRQIIGRAQVGANCPSDQGLQHWQDMTNSFKSTAAQWHHLTG